MCAHAVAAEDEGDDAQVRGRGGGESEEAVARYDEEGGCEGGREREHGRAGGSRNACEDCKGRVACGIGVRSQDVFRRWRGTGARLSVFYV